MKPKISIVTAYYNRYDLIDNLIESILEQNYDNYELILVNDGSNDNIERKILRYQSERNLKVIYLEQPNQGKLTAMNAGTKIASGDLLIGIDSDDYFAPNALTITAEQYEIVKNDDKIAAVYFKSILINSDNEELPVPDFPVEQTTHFEQSYINNYIHDAGSFMKIDIAKSYPFVVLDGEKFSPEAIVGNRISQKYQTRYVNQVMKICKYQEEGLSANQNKLIWENPKGYYIYTSEILANHKLPFGKWLRHSLANSVFAAKTKVGYLRNISQSKKISYKISQAVIYPLGLLYNFIKRG